MLGKLIVIIIGLAFHGKIALGDNFERISDQLQVVGTITQKTPTGVSGIVILKDAKTNRTKPVEIGKAFTFAGVVYRIAEINSKAVVISDGIAKLPLAYINPPKDAGTSYVAQEDTEERFDSESDFDLEDEAEVRQEESEATADASKVSKSYRFRRSSDSESSVAAKVADDEDAIYEEEENRDDYLQENTEVESEDASEELPEDYEYREED